MAEGAGRSEIDLEVAHAVSRDMIELSSALDQVRAYAAVPDINADQFGKLAENVGVGTNFVAVRDALIGSIDKLVPVVHGMTEALAGTVGSITERDQDAAGVIGNAGGGQ
jgi:hypothetical protein